MENTKTTQGKSEAEYESEFVKKFVNDFKTGQSFLQQGNKDPDYVINHSSGELMSGINMIIVGQAMKDNNKRSNQVMTQAQKDSAGLFAKKGSHVICTAQFDIYDAWYRKNDPEVLAGKAEAGKHKVDENGNYVKDKRFSPIYACDDLTKPKFVEERDADGKVKHYEEDVFKTDKDGNVVTYTKDNDYVTKNGQKIHHNAGDPVIDHHKGSVMGTYVPGDPIVSNQKAKLPPFVSDELAPIPKPKDESIEEKLRYNLAVAFRGKLQGGFEGIQFSKKDLEQISEKFLAHPRDFANIVKSAEHRSMMTTAEYAKMQENIAAKQNTAQNEATEENKKSAKKSR